MESIFNEYTPYWYQAYQNFKSKMKLDEKYVPLIINHFRHDEKMDK